MSESGVRERVSSRLLMLLVAAAILASFAPVLGNNILSWDDLLYVGKNARLDFGRDGLRWAFASFHMGQYVPAACLSFSLDRVLWGSFPGGYHLTNLLWHAAGGLLWFGFWLRLLTRSVPAKRKDDAALAAAAATLLFCLHPLRVESVAWLAERREVLCGFFYAAALRAYLEACLAEGAPARRWRLGALLCFALSLLSKAASVTLPATLLILDVYPLRRLPSDPGRWGERPYRAVLLEKAPFAALSAAVCAVTAVALRRQGLMDGLARLSIPQRLAVAGYGLLFYVRKEFWPSSLLAVYELPRPFDPFAGRFLAWSAAALAAAFIVRRLSRGRPAVGASAAQYAVALLPASGLVSAGIPHLVADRFSYFPSLAFSGLAAAGMLGALARPRWRTAALAGAAAVLVGLGAASWMRCGDWADDETLWRSALAVEPGHLEAHVNLPAVLAKNGRSREAAVFAESAARLVPENAGAWDNLGAAFFSEGAWTRAEDAYARSSRLNPADGDARRGLGRSLAAQGRGEAAVEQFRAAATLDPEDAVSRYELGNAEFRLGRMDPAGDAFMDALRVDPKLGSAHANLGRVLELQGLSGAAVEEYRAAVRSGPSPEALYDWANLESKRGRGDVAVRLYREALRLEPGFDDARFNWGNALARLGKRREAAEQFRLVLGRHPGDAQARESLRRVSAR